MSRLPHVSAAAVVGLGILVTIVALALLLVGQPGSDHTLRIWMLELTSDRAVVILVVGLLAAALPTAAQVYMVAKSNTLEQPTSAGAIGARPHASDQPKGEEVIVPEAATRFVWPDQKAEWEMISLDELGELDDVSVWDAPLLKLARPALPNPNQIALKPVSQRSFRYRKGVHVVLTEDTTVDHLYLSGRLPHDEALTERILRAGIGVQLGSLRLEPARIPAAWREFEMEGDLPTGANGEVDVDAALQTLEDAMLTAIRKESGDHDLLEQIRSGLRNLQPRFPVARTLYHAASFRVYRKQDVVNVDPLLRLIWGDDVTTWNFMTALPFLDKAINLTSLEGVQWSDRGEFASFRIPTRIENVQINGTDSHLTVNRMFFIARDGDRFHVLRARLIESPMVDSQPAAEGLRRLVGSYRVGPSYQGRRAAGN